MPRHSSEAKLEHPTSSQPFSQPTPPSPALTNVFNLLSDLHITLLTRTFLITDFRTGHKSCPACSSLKTPGSCGPTCCLLSPHTYPALKLDRTWLSRATRDYAIYKNIVGEMRECGVGSKDGDGKKGVEVGEEKMKEWERNLEKLRRWGMSELERRAECEWFGDKGACKGCKGMDLGWVFERAWRRKERVKEVEGMESPGVKGGMVLFGGATTPTKGRKRGREDDGPYKTGNMKRARMGEKVETPRSLRRKAKRR